MPRCGWEGFCSKKARKAIRCAVCTSSLCRNTSLSLFALTWTVRHAIDEKSPLAGYDAERLEEGDARLFLSIEARDHTIGAFVYDMRIYTAADVLFGKHYAEAVTVDDQRRPVADLTRLSLVGPDTGAWWADI